MIGKVNVTAVLLIGVVAVGIVVFLGRNAPFVLNFCGRKIASWRLRVADRKIEQEALKLSFRRTVATRIEYGLRHGELGERLEVGGKSLPINTSTWREYILLSDQSHAKISRLEDLCRQFNHQMDAYDENDRANKA